MLVIVRMKTEGIMENYRCVASSSFRKVRGKEIFAKSMIEIIG